jgi:2-oxoglutarate ferredoxin oxidoreductase subunit beta
MAFNVQLKSSQLKTDVHPDWCPGCGDFGIINAIQSTIAQLGLAPWETYLFSGVGCSGKTPHFVKVYGSHTLHGRVLPFALGAKMANPHLTVIAAGGDGDGYGIGAGHFVHAGRRNIDLTYIVFNNEVYGLTKGQASPTLAQGAQPKSLSLPNINAGVNPLALAIVSGFTFVARSYAYDAKHLIATLSQAVQHRGMALVDVMQPCPTYNDIHTKEFFAAPFEDTTQGKTLPRILKLEDEGYNGKVNDPHNPEEIIQKRMAAIERASRLEDQFPVGVFYQVELPTYADRLAQNIPALQHGQGPVDLPYFDADMKPTVNLTQALQEFTL